MLVYQGVITSMTLDHPPSTPHLFGIGMVNCEAEQTTPSATWQVTDRPVSWWRLSPMGLREST